MLAMFRALIASLMCVLSVQWWDVGHMLTAAIAEIRLNELHPFASISFREISTSINDLVDNKSRTFIESACWPDDIKGTKYSMSLWNPWHYTDKTFVHDGVFPVINFTEVAVNSIELVQHAVKVLSSNGNMTTAEKALFARYLTHVVGDMHQPLHSVALFNSTFPSGDRGGNSIKIIMPNRTSQNLHSFWDAGGFMVQNDSWTLPRPLTLQNLTVLKQEAAQYIKIYGKQIEQLGKNISPVAWAMQSYRLAINTTYPQFENTNEVSQQYIDLTYQTSKKRIALAGYRLANLIISIYDKKLTKVNSNDLWTEQQVQVKNRNQNQNKLGIRNKIEINKNQ